jgi:hypothetical protein
MRQSELDGRVYLGLGDETWQAVEIDATRSLNRWSCCEDEGLADSGCRWIDRSHGAHSLMSDPTAISC